MIKVSCCHLNHVLQGLHEGMWAQIEDEEVLELCMGIPAEWWTLICQAKVAQVVMTGRLPPGPRGPQVGGAPIDDRGPRGDH
jgi:hypothetical protein